MHPWVRDFLLIRHQIMGWGWTLYIICTGQQLKEEAREFIERKRSRAFFVPFRLRLSPFNTRPEYRDYAYLYVRMYIQFNFAVMGDFRKWNEPVNIVVQLSCETVAPTHAPSRHVRWPILFFMWPPVPCWLVVHLLGLPSLNYNIIGPFVGIQSSTHPDQHQAQWHFGQTQTLICL